MDYECDDKTAVQSAYVSFPYTRWVKLNGTTLYIWS